MLLCENTNTALLVILQIRNCWSACRQVRKSRASHIPQWRQVSPPFHTSPLLSKAFVGCFFVPSFRYRASGNKSSGHVTFALLSERRRSITRRGSLQGAVHGGSERTDHIFTLFKFSEGCNVASNISTAQWSTLEYEN